MKTKDYIDAAWRQSARDEAAAVYSDDCRATRQEVRVQKLCYIKGFFTGLILAVVLIFLTA